MRVMSSLEGKVFLFLALVSVVNAQNLFRIESDVDESSCLCGVNREILDNLENILKQSKNHCSNVSVHSENDFYSIETTIPTTTEGEITHPIREPVEIEHHVAYDKGGNVTTSTNDNDDESPKNIDTNDQLTNLLHQMGGQVTKLSSGFDRIEFLLEKLLDKMSTETDSTIKPASTVAPELSKPALAINEANTKPNQANRENESWFLNGLKPVAQTNEALTKPNQNTSLDPHTMEATLQSTVPNVVTNIFTNIDSLQHQIQKQPADDVGSLTSVDGSSSIELPKTSSNSVIMSTGEKLLLLWIEKQFESLHVTASVANHLRKAALNMFRSIMKQYMDRMGQLGSNLGQNMRSVTQIALNNTQSLISFIMRNYMNIAGGLMQIIGERVSFVGKQLDTTGDSIAHLPINPFEIFSNVMESLPNPTNYSKYFRAFGKQLLGDDESTRTKLVQSQPVSGSDDNSGLEQSTMNSNKQSGIFSKTMGALTKTFGNFLG